MNQQELVRILKSIYIWIPQTSVTAREKLAELIRHLGGAVQSFIKILFNLIGIVIVGCIFLIILILKLFWKFIKFLWKFTPWEKARRARELEQLQKEQEHYDNYIEKLKTGWIRQINPLVYIDGSIKYIYVYTTDTEETFNRYKVGETKKSPYDRIQEQDTTSNSGELRMVAYWHAGKLSDKELHKMLEESGYIRVRRNREWFVIEDPITVVSKLISKANS